MVFTTVSGLRLIDSRLKNQVRLGDSAYEREHEDDVGEAHLLAHASHRAGTPARSPRHRQDARNARRHESRASGCSRTARSLWLRPWWKEGCARRARHRSLNGLDSLREGLQRFRRGVFRCPAQLRFRLAGVHHDRRPRDVQPLQGRRNERHVRETADAAVTARPEPAPGARPAPRQRRRC